MKAWRLAAWGACLVWSAPEAAGSESLTEFCARAEAPQRCLTHQQGLLSCQDMPDASRHHCLSYYTPSLNCHRQRDSRHCEALSAAQTACGSLAGADRRQCVDARLPKPERGCAAGETCGDSPAESRTTALPLFE
ncbi:hypothetical protein [Chromobacterium sp. IIBBL 290-4]|uniref:hypothetical protein n=1 Tax=Chromobacterium sp. IIBBL 290-4 TaxID=2953890 RepID=UPI0020B76E57|nr:hypothetical protein [Chromobacterium sp. IIBBL 290-4]UTH75887.1 hypothetical protein NKT35_07220 [Chromobacterium sp. IIBBL 290-4]